MSELARLPSDLPAPGDDGAADHLVGIELPHVRFQSTSGVEVDLAHAAKGRDVAVSSPSGGKLRHLVVYVYPRTGTPGEPLPADWDDIPGARGCTPQSCAYRDSLTEFEALGATVIGISAQTPDRPSTPSSHPTATRPKSSPGSAADGLICQVCLDISARRRRFDGGAEN